MNLEFLMARLKQIKFDLYGITKEAAKTSALSFGELEKWEYLTGEDLDNKPRVDEKPKFEKSPLSKVFNKRLDWKDKKEGLLKRYIKKILKTKMNSS